MELQVLLGRNEVIQADKDKILELIKSLGNDVKQDDWKYLFIVNDSDNLRRNLIKHAESDSVIKCPTSLATNKSIRDLWHETIKKKLGRLTNYQQL